MLFTCSGSPAATDGSTPGLTARFHAIAGAASVTWLCASRLPEALDEAPQVMTICGRDQALTVHPNELRDVLTDLQTFVREELACGDATAREKMIGFLATLPGTLGAAEALADGLRRTREMLRERHPLSVGDDLGPAISVAAACRIDQTYVFVSGSIGACEGSALTLGAVSPEGETIAIGGVSDRPAAGQVRSFSALLTTRSITDDGWVLELTSPAGDGVETPPLRLVAEIDDARHAVLKTRQRSTAATGPTAEDQAIEILQRRRRERARPATVEAIGPPHEADLAIVLSLGSSSRLLEHHLAALAGLVASESDAGFAIVVALDGPEDPDRERWCVSQLYELYGVPMTLVMTGAPAGREGARLAACDATTSARILLLEGGVLPGAEPFVAPLLAFAQALDGACALVPRRVRHDGTIDDAGHMFELDANGRWTARPRLAGVHHTQPLASATHTVQAASTACLLVDRDAYVRAGRDAWRYLDDLSAGLDVCLSLGETGHPTWWVPRVSMFDGSAVEPAPTCADLSAEHDAELMSRLRSGSIEAAIARSPLGRESGR